MRFQAVASFVLTFLLTIATLNAATTPKKEIMPYPEPDAVPGTLKNADESISKIMVSHPYPTKYPDLVETGVDLTDARVKRIDDFIEGHGEFKGLTDKEIYIHQYELGNPKYTGVMKKAHAKDIPVYVIADMDAHLNGEYREGQTTSTNFEKATFKSGTNGDAIKDLLGDGFQYAITHPDSKWIIASQPLHNKKNNQETPIDHVKAEYLVGKRNGKRVVSAAFGTHNPPPHQRLNMFFVIAEPVIADYMFERTLENLETYKKGGEISDIPYRKPLRVTYTDGSYVEASYTASGKIKVNPNSRIALRFQNAADHPEQFKVTGVYMRHFVLTDADIVESLRTLMGVQKEFKVRGLFDKQFFSDYGFGMALVLGGEELFRAFGHPILEFSPELLPRMDTYIYERGADGTTITDPDGEPLGVHLNHDKTTLTDMLEALVPTSYTDTGTLNASAHFANNEVQLEHRLVGGNRRFADAIRESINQTIDLEPQYSIPFETALARLIIEHLTDHTFVEISIPQTEKVFKAFKDGRYKEAFDDLREIHKSPTTIKKKLPEAQFEESLKKISNFLDWYSNNKEIPHADAGISVHRLFHVTEAILHASIFPPYVRMMLNEAVRSPGSNEAGIEKLTREVWEKLELPGKYPEPTLGQIPPDDDQTIPEPNAEGKLSDSVKYTVDCDTHLGGQAHVPPANDNGKPF